MFREDSLLLVCIAPYFASLNSLTLSSSLQNSVSCKCQSKMEMCNGLEFRTVPTFSMTQIIMVVGTLYCYKHSHRATTVHQK